MQYIQIKRLQVFTVKLIWEILLTIRAFLPINRLQTYKVCRPACAA